MSVRIFYYTYAAPSRFGIAGDKILVLIGIISISYVKSVNIASIDNDLVQDININYSPFYSSSRQERT